MKSFKMLAAATLFALTSASAAHAGAKSAVTAPATAGTNRLFCDVTNIDTNPKEVTIEIVDINNNVVLGPYTPLMPPGTGDYLGSATGAAAYCRFTVNGSTKKIRGIAIYDDTTSYVMSLPAE